MADVTLYYFPSSYYSLKVLLALYEKNVSFKEQIVNIHDSEQNEDWYLRINKNGEVPVLKLGDQYIAESEDIIDLIDATFTSGPRLVPDVETGVGREIADFRRTLQDIPIDVITFGVLANRQFCVTEIQFPKFMLQKNSRERMEQNFDGQLQKYRKMLETCTQDLKPSVEQKMAKIARRRTLVLSENEVAKRLDALEGVFDRIAALIDKSQKGTTGGETVWLFGSEMTAADISAVNLMFRLETMGVLARYASPEVRPSVFDYYIGMKNRSNVQKIIQSFGKVVSIHMKMALKSVAKKVLKVGLVVGLAAIGYVGYREYSKIAGGLKRA